MFYMKNIMEFILNLGVFVPCPVGIPLGVAKFRQRLTINFFFDLNHEITKLIPFKIKIRYDNNLNCINY